MCDTFVALPDVTLDGAVIFGKNSDRPGGESQVVEAYPALDHPAGARLQCTWLEIPQSHHTFAVLLSRPAWMWGAEMGANEHGVVIGNEAVSSNQPCAETGLLGMDLVRLGLERGASAREALQVIVDLMAAHGQGGNCAEHFDFTYHNSYLLADPNEAWVLETAGRYWVADRVTQGTRSISNSLSIHGVGDLRCAALEPPETDGAFDFAWHFGGVMAKQPPPPQSREGRVRMLCRQHAGDFSIDIAKTILRDHEGGVCMHGGFETRGSQVSSLGPAGHEHWFIEAPFPCQEQFRPWNFLH
jgi:secernin